jgi:hypothetical protein
MKKDEKLLNVSLEGINLVIRKELLQDKELERRISYIERDHESIKKALKRVGIVVY